ERRRVRDVPERPSRRAERGPLLVRVLSGLSRFGVPGSFRDPHGGPIARVGVVRGGFGRLGRAIRKAPHRLLLSGHGAKAPCSHGPASAYAARKRAPKRLAGA